MRYLIAILFIIMVFLAGCIRDANTIKSENCYDYKTTYGQISCLKEKANYYAASGDLETALNKCEEIYKITGKCDALPSLTNIFSFDYYKTIGGISYSDCIKDITYYRGTNYYVESSTNMPRDVCYNLLKRCGSGATTSRFARFIGYIIPGTSIPIDPVSAETDYRQCQEIGFKSRTFENDLKDNYKYVFGLPP